MALDKETYALLQSINSLCPNGIYEILSIDDITSAMPKKYKLNAKRIREKMEELAQKKYISIKYSDEREFCVAPIKRNEANGEEGGEKDKEETIENKKWLKRCAVCGFLSSFFGALLGGVLMYIIINFLVK